MLETSAHKLGLILLDPNGHIKIDENV